MGCRREAAAVGGAMTDRLLLALDTATRQPALALARPDGQVLAARSWTSRHRHGEQLLSELDALLGEVGAGPRHLRGLVVGTGPGSFTGLRIGLATAKVLAYSLSVPLVGVPTTAALAAAAHAPGGPGDVAVTLPAGAADRYVSLYRVGEGFVEELSPTALVATDEQARAAAGGALLVAVELEPPAVPQDAAERGRAALAGLAASLVRLGARRLAEGGHDDPATLVPAYVALPRGIARAAEEMVWSPDLR
jgi:tRNA threonylcarbamoyladenosine biosynthesis protein TsaB